MLISNKKLTILSVLLICSILLIFNCNKTYAIVEATNEFYVNDYANILDSQTEQYIISVNKALNSKTGAQVVVVTVPNLEGNSLEEYSTELFRKFGIGDKTKNNGLLLLLALEERQFRVEVGYGLEGILPDAKTGRIQDEYIIPYLKQNDWNNGIRNGFNAFVEEIKNEYDVDINTQQAEPVELVKDSSYDFTVGTVFVMMSIFLGEILKAVNIKKDKTKTVTIIAIISLIIDIVIRSILEITVVAVILDIIAFIIGIVFGSVSRRGYYGGRIWPEDGFGRRRIRPEVDSLVEAVRHGGGRKL